MAVGDIPLTFFFMFWLVNHLDCEFVCETVAASGSSAAAGAIVSSFFFFGFFIFFFFFKGDGVVGVSTLLPPYNHLISKMKV